MLSKKVKNITIIISVIIVLLMCTIGTIRSAYSCYVEEGFAAVLPDDASTEAYDMLQVVHLGEIAEEQRFFSVPTIVALEQSKGTKMSAYLDEQAEKHKQEYIAQTEKQVPRQGAVVKPIVPPAEVASPGDATVNNGTALTNEELAQIGVSANDFIAICCVVYSEIRGGSYSAKANVINVIRNRVYSGAFPNSYAGVCYQSGQFVVGKMPGEALQRDVQSALLGGDTTGGALYFCTCLHCGRGNSHTLLFQDDAGHYFWQ